MAADNILKRARVCCGQSSLASVARTMLKRVRRRERKTDGEVEGSRTGGGVAKEGGGCT